MAVTPDPDANTDLAPAVQPSVSSTTPSPWNEATSPWLGAKVRALRESAVLSQQELAVRLGIHQSLVGMIEQSDRKVSLGQAILLAKELGVGLAAFDDPTTLADLTTDGGVSVAKSEDETQAIAAGFLDQARMAAFVAGRRSLRLYILKLLQEQEGLPGGGYSPMSTTRRRERSDKGKPRGKKGGTVTP